MSNDYAIYVGGVRYVKADRIEELEAENHLFKTSNIIEVATHNNRVTEYMFHWEGRALDAEAKLAKAVEALGGVMRHMPDHPDTVWIEASETFAELTGGKDE